MEKEKAFVEKKIVLLVQTTLGDKWKNNDECSFIETKNGEEYIVREKQQ